MADTYTQLYIHIIFAIKARQSLIPKQHKEELHKYITGIIHSKNQTVIQINSMPYHIHILVGITLDTAISDLVRDIKANSSKFINRQRWIVGRFEWQTGFAAFSYAHSQLDTLLLVILKIRRSIILAKRSGKNIWHFLSVLMFRIIRNMFLIRTR